MAKEFAFRGMNQRVRRKNFRKRRQRATGGQEDGRTYDSIVAPVQFPHHLRDRRQSQALRDSGTVRKVSLRLWESEAGGIVIGLVGSGDSRIRGDDAPPVDYL